MDWIKNALELAQDAGQVLLLLAAVFGATRWGKKLRLDAAASEWERIRTAVWEAVRATEQLHSKDSDEAKGSKLRSLRKRDEALARARALLPGTSIDGESLMDLVEAAVHDLNAVGGGGL